MRELRVDINNKIATYNTRSGVIVCGNTNYKIKFTFDEEWNEFEYKTARFAWNDKYIDVVFYGDSVAVPMLSQTTMLTVGVFAGENLHTTTPAKIPCMLSILCVSDRAKEAEYYEVDGTLEYRLPAIRPEDHSKILQAVNGKYELREAPDLTMNEGMVSAALETKVKPLQNKVTELEAEIDEVKTNFGGEAIRGELNKLNSLIFGNTWVLNETFEDEIFESNLEYTLNFASNGKHFAKIEFSKTTNDQGIDTHTIHYRDADGNRTRVYTTNKTNRWEDEAYRNIITEDAVSLDRVATRVKEEEETDAITLVGAINELGDKVETNQTAIERLNKLPAIIFETEEDIAELAKKFNLDTVTIVGAIDKLATTTNNLNKQYEGIKEDMDAICIPFEFKKWGAEIEFGGLYINIDTLKVWIKIAGYKYTISDWEQVQAILEWIKGFCGGVGEVLGEFGEEALVIGETVGNTIASGTKQALGWVNGVGETIKDVINTICKALWLPEPFPENEEPNKESAEMAGQLIAGAVEAQKKVVSPAWKMKDTFEDTDIFEYEFDFTSNGKTFSKMRSQINTGDNGLKTYVIHYIWYENGEERQTTVYSSAKSGGWLDTAYQTVYACNPTASSTAILNNVAGASWKLNEKPKANFRLKCDFIANNVTYKEIRVLRAEGIYSPDDSRYQYDRDKIAFCKSYVDFDEGDVVYYYHPQLNEGGWLNHISGEYDNPTSVYRDITILAPTDEIAYQLRKIGVEVTEKLETTAQTMTGGLNEINRYMGNLSELEVKEFTPYSMRRSVEEEAPEQDTLVKAINRVYRRTVATEETVNELNENLQSKTDSTLKTDSKEIVGAINELHEKITTYPTYNIPSGWEAPSGYGNFVIDYDVYVDGKLYSNYKYLLIGYAVSNSLVSTPQANSIAIATTSSLKSIDALTSFEIVIKGGTQSTNTNLINWLETYGELEEDIDLSAYQTKEDENLETESKEIVGAINELNSKKNDKIDIISVTGNPMDIEVKNDGILWENFFSMNDGAYTGDFYHRVPIVAGDNVTFEVEGSVVKINAQGGSSSRAIIDVVELPTENINEEAFYRMLTGTFYYNSTSQHNWTCYIVESLADEGVPVTIDMVNISLYYAIDTGTVSGYVNTALSGVVGVPVGWYPVEALAQAFDLDWGGIIWSELDSPVDNTYRLLLSYSLYQYKNKWENISEKVGWVGEIAGAEVFNSLSNEAKGVCSHAEGFCTIAEGENSHAEGWYTVANGDYQHAQGRFNIEDTENKYAHIVGNGEAGNRSNAHTIDWQGNGWFAGTIKVGGTGQDDENAKELATKDDLSNLATVDKVGYVSNHDDIAEVMDDGDGIYWESVSKYYDSDFNEITAVTMAQKIPLVAGKNVTFSYDEENQFVKINATGGGSSGVSLKGTWTVIDEPEIPTSDMPLEFTSNGTEYMAIGYTSMGSSTWGINALSYQSYEGYYDAAYTNNPSGSYGITHGWSNEGYKYITITKEPTNAKAIAWLGNNTDAPKVELPKEEMPQIRFTSMAENEDNVGYKFTVEIIGGGALQEGDALQICAKRMFGQTVDEFGNIKRPMKHKLRRFAEYTVTADDLDKRFLTVNVLIDSHTIPYLFFSNNKSGNALSPLYLRIRRPKGDLQNNDTGMTVDATFSNVVQVWKTYKTENLTLSLV